MLFKSLGIATATNTASNSEDSKPVTIRLTDSEVQLYDAVAKSMGLTRQDFLAHLIRNNFKQALTDFLIGYTQSSPSVSLCELINSNTDSDEVKQKGFLVTTFYLTRINGRRREEIHEHIENERFYQFATPRKGIFAETPKPEEK